MSCCQVISSFVEEEEEEEVVVEEVSAYIRLSMAYQSLLQLESFTWNNITCYPVVTTCVEEDPHVPPILAEEDEFDLSDLPDLILDIDDVTNDIGHDRTNSGHIVVYDTQNLNNFPVNAQIVDSFQETYVDTKQL